MSHWISLVTAHGRMNGWVGEPDDKPNGAVVLVHDLFGVNDDIRAVAERFAAEGYLTLAPALFDSLQREVELTYAPENERLGASLAVRLGLETAVELTKTAADAIGHAGKVAIVGYGWGGAVGLVAAQALGAPCVSYFGDAKPSETGEAGVPLLLHHGAVDERFTVDAVARLGRVHLDMEVFSYPGGRAFDREGNPSQHDPASADVALERSLGFLRRLIRHENG